MRTYEEVRGEVGEGFPGEEDAPDGLTEEGEAGPSAVFDPFAFFEFYNVQSVCIEGDLEAVLRDATWIVRCMSRADRGLCCTWVLVRMSVLWTLSAV